jgi:hypothetical protein
MLLERLWLETLEGEIGAGFADAKWAYPINQNGNADQCLSSDETITRRAGR